MCLFFLKDSMPLEANEDYLLFSRSDSKWAHLIHCEEIFNSGLELLTPLWQAVLGIHCSAAVRTAWRWCTLLGNCSQLLGDSLRWSNHELVCSALVRTTRTSSRRRCTMGTRCSETSCGGYDPGYPWQTTWAAPLGVA